MKPRKTSSRSAGDATEPRTSWGDNYRSGDEDIQRLIEEQESALSDFREPEPISEDMAIALLGELANCCITNPDEKAARFYYMASVRPHFMNLPWCAAYRDPDCWRYFYGSGWRAIQHIRARLRTHDEWRLTCGNVSVSPRSFDSSRHRTTKRSWLICWERAASQYRTSTDT